MIKVVEVEVEVDDGCSDCVVMRGGEVNDIANDGENIEAVPLVPALVLTVTGAVAVAGVGTVVGTLHGIIPGTVLGPEKGPGVDVEILDGTVGHCVLAAVAFVFIFIFNFVLEGEEDVEIGIGEEVEEGGADVVIAMNGFEGASIRLPSPPTHISNNN